MYNLTQKIVFDVLKWTIYFGLAAVSVVLSWNVFMKYKSLDTTFKRSELPVSDIPTITVCFNPQNENFSLGLDFNIKKYTG